MRKLFCLVALFLVVITLVSCGKQSSLNTNVPTGSLSQTEVYASLNDDKLSQKDLYLEMRGSAYDTFISELKKLAVSPSDFGLNVDNAELIDIINEACYNTDDITKLNSTTKESYEKQFKDSMALLNVDTTNGIYSDAVKAYYLQELAFDKYALKQITTETSKYYYKNEYLKSGNEFLLDADGNKQSNPYYVSDDDFETYYNNNMKEDASLEAIILGFNSVNDARYFLGECLDKFGELNFENDNALETFQNAYRKVFGLLDTEEVPTTYTNEELLKFNANLRSAINNLEDNSYTTRLIQAGSKKYAVYLLEGKETKEYKDLSEAELAQVKEDKLNSLIDSTAVANIMSDLLNSSELSIYDPLLSKLYKADNADFEELTSDKWEDSFNNKVASFKLNGAEKTLTVEALYNALSKTLGPVVASKYFEQKLLLEKHASLITEEDLTEINNSISTTKSSFEAGSLTGYPSSLTADEFNLVYYGSTNSDDVVNKLKVQKILTYLQTKYDESKITTILEKFGQQYYNNYFSLKIVHILISSDQSMTGSMDDPELVNINEEYVATLANAILAEAKYIIDNNYLGQAAALTFVAKQYAAGEQLLSDPTKTWNDYKKYNLSVKVENLGNVNSTSASSYVQSFADGVKALYNTLKEDSKQASNYLPESVTTEDLISTNYGYHVLTSIGTDTLKTAKYESEKTYEYIWNGVTHSKVDGTEVSINNDSQDWPTATQLEVYLAVGADKIENTVTTPIEYTFNTFTSRYATSQFQNIYFIYNNILSDLVLSAPDKAYLVNYLQVQKNSIDNYKDYSQTAEQAFAGWWNEFGCN